MAVGHHDTVSCAFDPSTVRRLVEIHGRMKRCMALDGQVPGGVYLCQVAESVSCGACCGLYNVQDARLDALEASLARRTEIFEGTSRDMDSVLGFKERIESKEVQERPFSAFHHCPYLGLIGKQRSRVGCLLHPLADGNNGIDWRGLSFYGGMACRVYFCPSCRELPPVYKAIVERTAPHWHLYGLVITETEMLNNFFQSLESLTQRPLTVNDICDNDRAVEWLWEFFAFKLRWPFRHRTHSVWGSYFFHDARYAHPEIEYGRFGVTGSRYDAILKALRSDFGSSEELKKAELSIDEIVENLAICVASRH